MNYNKMKYTHCKMPHKWHIFHYFLNNLHRNCANKIIQKIIKWDRKRIDINTEIHEYTIFTWHTYTFYNRDNIDHSFALDNKNMLPWILIHVCSCTNKCGWDKNILCEFIYKIAQYEHIHSVDICIKMRIIKIRTPLSGI